VKWFYSSWFKGELCLALNYAAAGIDARNVSGPPVKHKLRAIGSRRTELAAALPGVKGDKRGDS